MSGLAARMIRAAVGIEMLLMPRKPDPFKDRARL